jgi:hypothetical protein
MRTMDTSGGFLPIAAGLRLAALIALILVSPLHPSLAQSGASDAPPVLHDLAGLGELRSQFESDVDKVRIVLLLSPT